VTRHVYVDESKRGGYLLAASMHPTEELAEARSLMRGLVLKGQRRVHMTKESDPRRKVIVATLVKAGIRANVYDAGRGYGHELDAPQACLRALVDDIARHPDSMLILKQDDSLLDWDRRCLYAQTRAAGTASLRYEHRRAATDQLLGTPTPSQGAGPKEGTGDGASLRWSPRSATSKHPEQREARLTNRPDGCRAHFSPLLRRTRPV
jgi:hypothetical protein